MPAGVGEVAWAGGRLPKAGKPTGDVKALIDDCLLRRQACRQELPSLCMARSEGGQKLLMLVHQLQGMKRCLDVFSQDSPARSGGLYTQLLVFGKTGS